MVHDEKDTSNIPAADNGALSLPDGNLIADVNELDPTGFVWVGGRKLFLGQPKVENIAGVISKSDERADLRATGICRWPLTLQGSRFCGGAPVSSSAKHFGDNIPCVVVCEFDSTTNLGRARGSEDVSANSRGEHACTFTKLCQSGRRKGRAQTHRQTLHGQVHVRSLRRR
jgi:hypothetical protein